LTIPANFHGLARFKYHVADAAGLGASATAAVFVDAQKVRLVYQTNEDGGVDNLYVNDLTSQPRKITSQTSSSTTFLLYNVSTNGRTIFWEEASGNSTTYTVQSIWTVPADGSSPARQ